MTDIDKLIEQILYDGKLSESGCFDEKIYRDEPILRPASKLPSYTPPMYREMKKIAESFDPFVNTAQQIFYRQGKFMEDFEDDFDYKGSFEKYYPTYQSMNTSQLRGYFSWRTKVRRGDIQPTCLSFAFVYVYELINQIGVKSDEEGFHRLVEFSEAYAKIDRKISSYTKMWIADYAVYYGLDPSLLNEIGFFNSDNAAAVLIGFARHTDEEIFDALKELSTYNVEKSKFCKEYPDDFKAVCCRVFARMNEQFEKKKNKSYAENLFGSAISCDYTMFAYAVFYDRKQYKSYEYTLGEAGKYRCQNGRWSCERLIGGRGKNRQIGILLKTVDCVMRHKYGFKSQIREDGATKLMTAAAEKETDDFLKLKKQSAMPKIEIDVSKLQGIRRASDLTRDRLIIDEEIDPEPIAAAPEPEPQNDTPLDSTEYGFMQRMLYGGDAAAFVKEKGALISVTADSVNEKLFDMFGDTVIVFDGDTPELIEDYTEELKGIIKP